MTTGATRRRRAELVRETWDVTRHRGLFLGALLGALVVVAALVLRDGPRALGTPGPLAGPHARVACASCHAVSAARASCGGCHEPHPSRRTAHRALADTGALPCGGCHAMHQGAIGLAFLADGAITASGNGFERTVVRGESEADDEVELLSSVPLVAASSCASCHDLAAPRDPAAHCFAREAAFSLCFDEHRRPATGSPASPATRDAAVERTRLLVRGSALSASLPGDGRLAEGALVAVALGVTGLVVSLRRRRATRPALPPASGAAPGPRRLPVIDPARCLGCNACVDACPYDALVVRRYVAVLARPEACCGAGPCVETCPNGSLTLVAAGAPARGPRLSSELELLGRPGLFVAGDASGGTLIRNALRQGAAAARVIAGRLQTEPHGAARSGDTLDLVVVGAGPAGLSAGLTARSLALSVAVLDQAGVAASIRRFSRQKLVLGRDAGPEERLPLWIGDAKKEELLERWQLAIRTADLVVREGVRVRGIARKESPSGARFLVTADAPDGNTLVLAARYVVLAVGTRGTPRPLAVPVPDAASARVHYELSDARAMAGQRCVIVGLGDVAMESAVALAAQPGTVVTVLHRGAGFRRGSQRNVDAVSALVAKGRVRLLLDAEVKRIGAASLEIGVAGRTVTLEFDALFVHLGGVPSQALLDGADGCLSS